MGDGDGVEQSNLGDDARDCLLQLLWLMVVQLGHIIMWGSCLPSLLSLDQTVSTESASSLEAENFLPPSHHHVTIKVGYLNTEI